MRRFFAKSILDVMGARVITTKRNPKLGQRAERRAMAVVFAAILGPLALTYILVAVDMRVDLSELKSRPADHGGGTSLFGWKDLEGSPSGRVRMVGYMMDGYRPVPEGTLVKTFILMPEAGQLLHPAHRTPDEMVEVWMDGEQTIRYSDRSLIWVEGSLRRVRGRSAGDLASYAIFNATVKSAAEREIKDLFR